jgi:hypothetical protein
MRIALILLSLTQCSAVTDHQKYDIKDYTCIACKMKRERKKQHCDIPGKASKILER